MNALIDYVINENNFVLSPERTMFWEKQKALIIAGLHIGKPGPSRKPGFPVSQNNFKKDLKRLLTEILSFKAEQLIIVGPLSLSRSAKERELFKKWRNGFSPLNILLVDNHPDIPETAWYDELNITRKEKLQIDKFSFCSSPEKINAASSVAGAYTFCGHLHPGIPMKRTRKKVLLFPCFYFKNTYAVLPAFSGFFDLTTIEPEEGENVFSISETGIVQVQ
jgi:DNA ligase-associated metallophosphoesterase